MFCRNPYICYCINSFLFHLINTGAKGCEHQRTIKEEKRDRVTQPDGSSKENEERKTTGGESDQFDGGTHRRGKHRAKYFSRLFAITCYLNVLLNKF